jgi:predicted nucleic acid-binding Zn finger protein
VILLKDSASKEIAALDKLCEDIGRARLLSVENKSRLLSIFGPRFEKAFSLIKSGKVRRYQFKPSGRLIWSVRGKTGEYQVIPESNFCNCDDYYFRVMDKKKALCYHIIAQRVANALRRYSEFALPDADYGKVTSKWKRIALREIS